MSFNSPRPHKRPRHIRIVLNAIFFTEIFNIKRNPCGFGAALLREHVLHTAFFAVAPAPERC